MPHSARNQTQTPPRVGLQSTKRYPNISIFTVSSELTSGPPVTNLVTGISIGFQKGDRSVIIDVLKLSDQGFLTPSCEYRLNGDGWGL